MTAVPLSNVASSPGLSVFAYCLASISMTVANKYCVSGPKWNMSFFFLAFQSTICVLAIQTCKITGFIPKLSKFDLTKAKKWFPVSCLLAGMIYTGAQALQFLSVPVFTIFKNMTIIVIAYGEVIWFGGKVAPTALLSFGLMVLSSVIAAWADFHHVVESYGDSYGETYGMEAASENVAEEISTLNAGYVWMSLNILCSAAYALSMRKVIKRTGFNDWETMFYNNFLSIPVLMVGSLLFEDWSQINVNANFPPESRHHQLFAMLYSGLAAIFISYASAWCIRVTSSTTYSMVGSLNKLPIAVSGLIFFGAPVTIGSVSAIVLGFVSGLVFTWAKLREAEKKKMALPTREVEKDPEKA